MREMKTPYPRSVCCNTSYKVEGNTTMYYICNKCRKPCDITLK